VCNYRIFMCIEMSVAVYEMSGAPLEPDIHMLSCSICGVFSWQIQGCKNFYNLSFLYLFADSLRNYLQSDSN
jgi:hypothetical protein